ncbi:CHAD domain-containing protein [Teredinibacter purpureus]|uniref:CHAD domain-containing protein n=1 Tax=Teredinibacter purpureus TaxID=2731756 RepID=UPI0005F7DE0F|nr:CHAD domain-containing protein [Teredinibacter purpureus]
MSQMKHEPPITPTTRPLLNTRADDNGFGLHPSATSQASLLAIVKTQFTYARAHESGIVNDAATTFLHRYRVSFRKLRSLLKSTKKCFSPCDERYFRQHLSQFSSSTNALRDLDVFLLNEKKYRNLVPLQYKAGMDALFRNIKVERTREHQNVVASIRHPVYDVICNEIEIRCLQTTHTASKYSERPILLTAKKSLRKSHVRIYTKANTMTDNTTDEEIHKLRIDCKRLRYLLEFFTELFARSDIEPLIETLKSLQTVLGDFNDYSVQVTALEARINTTTCRNERVATLALIESLTRKKNLGKDNIIPILTAFCSPAEHQAFNDLTHL